MTIAIKISEQPMSSENVTFSCQNTTAIIIPNTDSREKINAAVDAYTYCCPIACSMFVTDMQIKPKYTAAKME